MTYEQATSIVAHYAPFRFFVTLTFRKPTSKREGIAHLKAILKRLHRTMLGSNWRRRPFIEGVASMETTFYRKGSKVAQGCHFHLLVKDHPSFGGEEAAACHALSKALLKVTRSMKHSSVTELFHKKSGVRVDPVLDMGVCGYVVKEARLGDAWDVSERLFLINGLLDD
jgi:hypothetical protein